MTTEDLVKERIRQTTGQHTRWLYFSGDRCAWYNGSDFICQLNWHDTDDEGNGPIMSWAKPYRLL